MPNQLPRLLKMMSLKIHPRLYIVVATLMLAGVQTAAQESGVFMQDAGSVPPRGNATRDFQRAEVWQGKKRVDIGNQLPYKPAEILYGEPQQLRSKEPAALERRASAATASAEFDTPGVNEVKTAIAKSGVVRSAAMSDAKVAHELLTRAKQLAEDGDLATAQRLTEQVRDLLTESSSLKPATPKSQPRLEKGEAVQVAAGEPAAAQPAHKGRASSSGISTSSQSTLAAQSPRELEAPSAPKPLPRSLMRSRPSEVFRGTAKTFANEASTAAHEELESALTAGSNADSRSPNQYVVYNSPSQAGDNMPHAIPAVTVNFDMSNGGIRALPGHDSATGAPTAMVPHAKSAATTIVLYFFGGLILGVGTLGGSLFVLAKLIAHRPIDRQEAPPLQASHSEPNHTERPDHAERPAFESDIALDAGHSTSSSTSDHTSPVAAVEQPVRPANVVSTRPSEEKKASGILEGIFQDNLRMQRQIGRVAEVA